MIDPNLHLLYFLGLPIDKKILAKSERLTRVLIPYIKFWEFCFETFSKKFFGNLIVYEAEQIAGVYHV